MSDLPDNRVKAPDRDHSTDRQKRIIDRLIEKRGKLLIPYQIWLHAPGVAEGMEALGTYLNTGSSLSKQELELVILITVVHWQSPFPTNGHEKHARSAGLDEDIIQAVLDQRQIEIDDPRLSAVSKMAHRLLANQTVSDLDFEKFETAIGRHGIAEVVSLIGYFTSVALAMKLHNVQPKS